MRRLLLAVLALVASALALPLGAQAHPERDTQFPDGNVGSVPDVRTSGPAEVVCKPDSAQRLQSSYRLTPAQITAARIELVLRTSSRRHIDLIHRRAHRSASHRRRFSRAQHRKASHRRAAHARNHRRSAARIRAAASAGQREGMDRIEQLLDCEHAHIQAGVNAAKSGERVLVMPGVYREEPSRAVKFVGPEAAGSGDDAQGGGAGGGLDPAPSGLDGFLQALGLRSSSPPQARAAQSGGGGICDSMQEFEQPSDGDAPVPNYRFQLECPNSRNLIAVIGDTNDDRKCDQRCNLQIEGMGRRPQDVLIVGDRIKRDIIRGDRADGLTIRNMTLEQGAFNNIDIVETNGFRVEDLETRYAQNYGVLTFTSDHGLYQRIDAHGNGDSGVYPGSGPEGRCQRYGIEIREVYSHDNVLGYSGTAGNGVYTHDSRFEDNSAGIATDSFASGHPGMPQDCAKWENNTIKSNNQNFFVKERQEFCAKTSFDKRPREIVCPQFQVPVGTGIIMAGANDNVIGGNTIFDQWREGILLLYVPATVRGENEPEKQNDTSNGNRFVNNRMGVRPDGTRDPNGVDFYWDEQGRGNCWSGNSGLNGAATTSDPRSLPTCEDELNKTIQRPVNASKSAQEAPCATWNPKDNQFPPGCDWFTTPAEPK